MFAADNGRAAPSGAALCVFAKTRADQRGRRAFFLVLLPLASVAVAWPLPLVPGVVMSVPLMVPLGVAMPELSIGEPDGVDAAGGLPGVG